MAVLPPVILVLAGLAGLARAALRYLRELREPGYDLMGASGGFARDWMIASLPIALGVVLLPSVAWYWGLTVPVALYLAIMPCKLGLDRVRDLTRSPPGPPSGS